MEGIEILHSHISHIIVLVMEIARHVGLGLYDQERLESEKTKAMRRAYLFKQMIKVTKWIFHFDPTFSGAGDPAS